jgi:hypothetical protein
MEEAVELFSSFVSGLTQLRRIGVLVVDTSMAPNEDGAPDASPDVVVDEARYAELTGKIFDADEFVIRHLGGLGPERLEQVRLEAEAGELDVPRHSAEPARDAAAAQPRLKRSSSALSAASTFGERSRSSSSSNRATSTRATSPDAAGGSSGEEDDSEAEQDDPDPWPLDCAISKEQKNPIVRACGLFVELVMSLCCSYKGDFRLDESYADELCYNALEGLILSQRHRSAASLHLHLLSSFDGKVDSAVFCSLVERLEQKRVQDQSALATLKHWLCDLSLLIELRRRNIDLDVELTSKKSSLQNCGVTPQRSEEGDLDICTGPPLTDEEFDAIATDMQESQARAFALARILVQSRTLAVLIPLSLDRLIVQEACSDGGAVAVELARLFAQTREISRTSYHPGESAARFEAQAVPGWRGFVDGAEYLQANFFGPLVDELDTRFPYLSVSWNGHRPWNLDDLAQEFKIPVFEGESDVSDDAEKHISWSSSDFLHDCGGAGANVRANQRFTCDSRPAQPGRTQAPKTSETELRVGSFGVKGKGELDLLQRRLPHSVRSVAYAPHPPLFPVPIPSSSLLSIFPSSSSPPPRLAHILLT